MVEKFRRQKLKRKVLQRQLNVYSVSAPIKLLHVQLMTSVSLAESQSVGHLTTEALWLGHTEALGHI